MTQIAIKAMAQALDSNNPRSALKPCDMYLRALGLYDGGE